MIKTIWAFIVFLLVKCYKYNPMVSTTFGKKYNEHIHKGPNVFLNSLILPNNLHEQNLNLIMKISLYHQKNNLLDCTWEKCYSEFYTTDIARSITDEQTTSKNIVYYFLSPEKTTYLP